MINSGIPTDFLPSECFATYSDLFFTASSYVMFIQQSIIVMHVIMNKGEFWERLYILSVDLFTYIIFFAIATDLNFMIMGSLDSKKSLTS